MTESSAATGEATLARIVEGLALIERRLAFVEETTLNVRLERKIEDLRAEVASLERYKIAVQEIREAFGLAPDDTSTWVQQLVRNCVIDMRKAMVHLGVEPAIAVSLSHQVVWECQRVEMERERASRAKEGEAKP